MSRSILSTLSYSKDSFPISVKLVILLQTLPLYLTFDGSLPILFYASSGAWILCYWFELHAGCGRSGDRRFARIKPTFELAVDPQWKSHGSDRLLQD